jgi:hypothetical protein
MMDNADEEPAHLRCRRKRMCSATGLDAALLEPGILVLDEKPFAIRRTNRS